MKIFKIGRDSQACDIVIDDPRGVISRVHAVLKINNKGKYSIADCSTNGTYVNGIKIESGVEVPITRKDRVSFAHVINLDWDFIPNPAKKTRIAVFSAIAAVLLVSAGGVFAYSVINNKPVKGRTEQPVFVADSLTTKTPVKKDSVAQKPKPAPAKKPAPEKTKPAEPVKKPVPQDTTETTIITNPIL